MWHQRAVVLLVTLIGYGAASHYRDQCWDDSESEYYDCPPGEYFNEYAGEESDAEYCPRTDQDLEPESYPPDYPEWSEPRCMCSGNYLRDEYGQCVPPDQCPPIECTSPYEEYVKCPSPCPGESCAESVMNPARCATRPRIVVPCKPACRCIRGYFRNEYGECVPYAECPTPTCPTGEYLNTCPNRNCPFDYCPTSSNSPYYCPPRKECGTPQCTCNFNTKRERIFGSCVPIAKCPPFQCNGPNEEFKACPRVCPGENCTDFLNNATCPRFRIGIVVPCKPQCRCKEGYYRNEKNICIPAKQCKPLGCKGDLNAQKGCGVPCGRTCKLYNKGPVPCPKICKLDACDCKPGYVLNEDNGKCVLPEQCPKEKGCNGDPNAVKGCGVPCGRTCALHDKGPVPCPRICKPNSCDCKPGYVLNDDTGKCVLPSECPKPKPTCNKPNEYYSPCFDPCPPQTCYSVIVGIACTAVVRECISGCRCIDGFYRNVNGDCVSEKDCLRCTNPHEFYACGGACDNVCETLRWQNQSACPIINVKCNDMCYCQKGYARNKDNICVPFDKCEPVRCPGAHEYFDCAGACDNVCATLSKQNKTDCPVVNKKCNSMCYCEDGYARNGNNECVPYDKCDVAAVVAVATPSEEDLKLFSKGTQQFNSKFFNEVTSNNKGKSVITSAFSVEPLLALLAFGAEGETQHQLLDTIGLPDLNVTSAVIPAVTKKLKDAKGVVLNLATKLYVPNGYELNENFEKISHDVFDSEVENVDFAKSVDAAKNINTWVENKTNNKIKNLISADSLNDLTRLVLVNAIYFKGSWKTQFPKGNTHDKDFHVSKDKTVKIPTMYVEAKFKYGESKKLDAKLIQLPYEGDEVYMLIILPNEIEGLPALQEKLKDSNILEEELKNMYLDTVQLSLPKVHIETTTDLKKLLNKIGCSKIFDQADSGLINLLKTKEALYVSQAIQKAFIEINEEGSEAAAANVFISVNRALAVRQRKVEFKADRPFLFALVNTPSTAVIFSGNYVG